MRPNDVILGPFVAMPAWLLALQQAVADDDFAVPGAEIPPLSALEELTSLRDSTAPEAQEDRSSLQRDLGASLEMLGPELEAAVNTVVTDFRRTTLSELPQLLRTREGIEVAAASAELLAEKLRSDDPTRAAWRDVVSTFRDDAAYDVCLRRLAILREIVIARGHAWVTEVERIAQIINDNPEQIAKVDGAEIDPGKQRGETAGISETRRLELLEVDLTRPAGEDEITVWLLISDAAINEGMLDCGPVRFFDVRFIRSRLGQAPADPRPFGLLPHGSHRFLGGRLAGDLKSDEQAVFVRVLSRGTTANAVAWAREIVIGLLDVATLGVPRPGWKLESGYVVVSEAGLSLRRFKLPDDPLQRWKYRPEHYLSRLDSDLASAWVAGDKAATEAVELARWDKALDLSSNAAFRVALGVRNLERVLPSARVARGSNPASHSRSVASHYLKESWCWRALRRELQDATYYATTPPQETDPFAEDDLNAFYEGFRRFADPNNFSPSDLVKHAAEISSLFEPGSSRGRLVGGIATKTQSSESSLEWLGQLGQNFDVLLARATRQRNATVHGSVPIPEVISGLLPFIADLGKQVVEIALSAAAGGRPRILAFETARLEAIEKTNQLQDGGNLADLLEES